MEPYSSWVPSSLRLILESIPQLHNITLFQLGTFACYNKIKLVVYRNIFSLFFLLHFCSFCWKKLRIKCSAACSLQHLLFFFYYFFWRCTNTRCFSSSLHQNSLQDNLRWLKFESKIVDPVEIIYLFTLFNLTAFLHVFFSEVLYWNFPGANA
jgi:hypothetical protein